LCVCAGEVERVLNIARCVTLERHTASDARSLVIRWDLKIAQPVDRFNDSCRKTGFDVPLNVAMNATFIC